MSTDGWVIAVHAQTYTKQLTSNVVFNNCIFDSTEMSDKVANANTPVANLDVNNYLGADLVKVDVTFNGGKIIANKFAQNSLCQAHSDDTITFGKGSDGSYIKLELPNGTTPLDHTDPTYFTIGENIAYFHDSSKVVGATTTVYTLAACTPAAGTHFCSSCGVEASTCADGTDSDHKCDVCGKGIDLNNDHVCDVCENEKVTDCIDENKDHYCDICGVIFVADCIDADSDLLCDYCGCVINDYGVKGIPSNYKDANTYPFFVFKYQNGTYTFEYAEKQFYGHQSGASAISRAIYGVLVANNVYDIESGKYVPQGSATTGVPEGVATAVIVMRRDYSLAWGSDTGREYFNNIAHAQGEIIIDLGGHTLSEAANSSGAVFHVTAKGWPDSADKVYTFPSTYTFKNGNVKTLKYSFATIGTHDSIETPEPGYDNSNWNWRIKDSAFTLNFENVTFGLADGATTTTLAYAPGGTVNNNPYDPAKVNVNFNGCTFDLLTNAPMAMYPVTIINNDTTGKDVDSDIVVEDSKILASDMSLITVYKTSNTNGTSTTIDKSELTLSMPKGSSAPLSSNTVVINTGAICAFKKSGTEGNFDVYSLTPAATIGFKTTSSVTLDTNFIYNIYVPVANVIAITIDGNAVENYNEKIVTVNGVECYHVEVNLAAGESLNDFVLRVTLDTGNGTSITAKSTLSVFKYSKTVLNGNYTASTKTLVKDMLVYAKAAHTYFEQTENVSAKLTEMETLLGGYSRELPTGEAKQPSNTTYLEQVTVHVGEVPSFRFYIREGYENFTLMGASVYDPEIAQSEEDITSKIRYGTDENGYYLEVVMYAYMMLGDISIKMDMGSELITEIYNLYSYYEYVKTLGDANLLAIVEGLMKYSDSAKDYCNVEYGKMILTVPEIIRPNDEGQYVSAVFSKPEYYSNVTYTTSHPNVYIENNKIYAKGIFDQETLVTVTARTDHHIATATVKVCKSFFIENYSGAETNLLINGSYIKDSNGNALTNNYVARGVVDMLRINNNKSHMQFHLYSKHRFLLWDDDNDGLFGAGYESVENGVHDHWSDVELNNEEYDATSGTLTLEWAIIVRDNVAYWYLDGVLRQTIVVEDGEAITGLNIGATGMDAWVYVTDVCTEAENADKYASLVSDYSNNFFIKHYNKMSYDISKAGVNIKDASGNNLAGNYVIKGSLEILDVNPANPHIQFSLKSGYRFLLWDNDSDGLFGAGFQDSTGHHDDVEVGENYDTTKGTLILDWAIVVRDNVAYWYLAGECVKTFTLSEGDTFTHLNIGVVRINVCFHITELCIESENAENYNSLLGEYNISAE